MALTISESDEPPIVETDPTNESPPVATDGDKLCLTCGLPIEYRPGHRRGKYHPECRPTGAQTASTGKGGRSTSIDTLIGQMAGLYRNVGMGIGFFPPTVADGMVIASEAGNLAESWRPLIEKDPQVRKMWEKITTGSGWGMVIMTHAGIGMAIAQNHGFKLPGMPQAPQAPQSYEVTTDE